MFKNSEKFHTQLKEAVELELENAVQVFAHYHERLGVERKAHDFTMADYCMDQMQTSTGHRRSHERFLENLSDGVEYALNQCFMGMDPGKGSMREMSEARANHLILRQYKTLAEGS